MKRFFAAAAVAAAVSGSMWLAVAPAQAKPAPPAPDRATLRVTPKWTYLGGGQFSITAVCSYGKDYRVIATPLLDHPVEVPGAGNLLMRVTGKTKPGMYVIELWCVTRRGQVDTMAVASVDVRKRLPGWKTAAPALPRHFKPNVIVQTGMRQVIVPAPAHAKAHAPKRG
jgi:hypothetical protein